MVFSSYSFLLLAFPLLILVYFLVPDRIKNGVLLLFSLGFYAWSGPGYLLLMLASVAINYVFGLFVNSATGEKKRKFLLSISIVMNLSLLMYFKYFNFIIDNLNSALKLSITFPEVLLPIGISFYTFQGMSYVIDVYRRQVEAQKNPFGIALYISLFPQLIAGPIVRYKDVAKEIESRHILVSEIEEGMFRFAIGLGKKVLIANVLGEYADYAFSLMPGQLSLVTAWLGALCFTLQIYYDFSGYSDMAIGIGKIFGFHFVENFNYPYVAGSITEFWRRWHISLSSWFRDYVYIPLGGNRKGIVRQIFNIAVVWMLTGFWHGAAWNFVLWGMYYALLLIIEKFLLAKVLDRIPVAFSHIFTLLLVVFGWVIFQSTGIEQISLMFSTMFDISTNSYLFKSQIYRFLKEYGIIFTFAAIGTTPVVKLMAEKLYSEMRSSVARVTIRTALFIGLLFFSVMRIVVSSYNPFIYFRF